MSSAHLFLKLINSGKSVILGESQVDGYEGQVIIDDWSWALTRKKTEGKSEGIEPSVFSFSKAMDRSTTALLSCLRSGQVLPSAEVTLKEGSEAEFELVVTMKEVRVIEYKLDGEVGEKDARAKEKWIFNYHTIEFDYQPSKKLSAEQRGALKALLTRAPGASNQPAAVDQEEKILTVMKTVPETGRRPLWKTIDGKIDSLGKETPDAPRKV